MTFPEPSRVICDSGLFGLGRWVNSTFAEIFFVWDALVHEALSALPLGT